MRRHFLIKQDGFVLMDAMIALVILTSSLIAVAYIFIQSSNTLKVTPRSTVAANIAREQIEDYQAASKANWDTFKDKMVAGTNKEDPSDKNKTYMVVVPKPTLRTDIGDGVAQVTVIVTWNEKDKNNKDISFNRRYVAFCTKP